MGSKPFTFREIEIARKEGMKLTPNQTGEEAWKAITIKFENVKQDDEFYHKGKGVWSRKTGLKKGNKTKIIKIPGMLLPEESKAIKEIIDKNVFRRSERKKRTIEYWSIDDVMRCTDKNIVGFLPIYKEGVKLS